MEISVEKTQCDMLIPLATPFLEWLRSMRRASRRRRSFRRRMPNGRKRMASRGGCRRNSTRYKADLAKKRSKKNTGRGHSVKRPVSECTFHSLRHNTTSWLKRAGVPKSVVRDIIGHESELVSRDYTHVDDASKRDAIRRLPNMPAP